MTAHASRTGARSIVQPTANMKNAEQIANACRPRRPNPSKSMRHRGPNAQWRYTGRGHAREIDEHLVRAACVSTVTARVMSSDLLRSPDQAGGSQHEQNDQDG